MPRTTSPARRTLRIQPLEARDVPAAVPLLAFGADDGTEPRLLVLNKDTGEVRFDRLAFGAAFRGGVRVTVGDVTGDGQDDVIAGTGPGVAGAVRVFDGATGNPVSRFAAVAPATAHPLAGSSRLLRAVSARPSTSGITVAAGDLNGDGRAEVITGSGPGGPATVAVYDGRTGRQFRRFSPAGFGTAGVRVAAGDVTGDGRAEILVTPASGPGSVVRVFDGRTFAPRGTFGTLAGVAHGNGLFVTAADTDGDGLAEVVVGAGTGDTVEVRDGRTGSLAQSFAAGVPAATGVRVGGTVFADDGAADILVGSADAGTWAARDGGGAAVAGGSLDGFNTGVWVAGSPEQAAINRHASRVVLDWNAAALDAIRAEKTPPPKASRALAILQASVFDAVNGITRGYRHYLVKPAAAVGSSVQAAAAGAAYTALVALFPGQTARFDALRTESLADVADGPAKTTGMAWGNTVATTILAARADDGSDVGVPYTPGTDPGDWQPTPPANAPALLPGWGDVTPFGVRNATHFLPPPPPDLSSPEYADELNEVRRLGGKTSTERTADQTEIAHFWADGAGTFTPPGHWNAVAAELAHADGLGLLQTTRLFAQLDIAAADAAIVCWRGKYEYNLWRPITAIRATADATWEPLLATPPFPAYTSGHSTFSGAASAVLAAHFGPDRAFSTTSDDGTVTRSFASFAQAADEAGMSRIYGGIHYASDNTAGLRCGRDLGAFVLKYLLKPR